MKTFKQHLIENDKVWYHGRNVKSDKFDLKYVGKGKDEDGPGFYFTKNKDFTNYYAQPNGIIITVKLNPRKLLKGKVSRNEVIKLIKNAPDHKETLYNWSEFYDKALSGAISAFMDYSTKKDAFEAIWSDFYLNQDATREYLEELIKMGYDGHIGTRMDDTMIIYNPKVIEIISTENYK